MTSKSTSRIPDPQTMTARTHDLNARTVRAEQVGRAMPWTLPAEKRRALLRETLHAMQVEDRQAART